MAEARFLIVSNVATRMTLETTHIDENIEKVSLKKSRLKPIGSSFVAIQKSVSNAFHMTGTVELKQEHSEDEFSKQPCTADCQKHGPTMS